MNTKKKTRKRKRCKKLSAQLLLRRSPMWSGQMLQVWIRPKLLCRRPLSSQQSSPNYLPVRESPGEVSFCTDPQVPVSLIWPRLVPLRLMELSTPWVLQIWSVSGSESQKDLSNSSSRWRERRSLQSSSSMRWTRCVEVDLREKMKPQEESRLSSLCKCKVWVMTMMASSCWEPQTCLGSWMLPSEEDLRREFTFLSQTCKPDLWCSRSDWDKLLIVWQRMTSSF